MTAVVRSQVGSNFRRLANNLQRDHQAMAMLSSLGIDEQTVQVVGLGMKEPYTRADGTKIEKVLAFPLAGDCGRRRYAYLNLPPLTVNPEHPLGWGPGAPEIVSSGGEGEILVVCANAIEVWQVQRAAAAGAVDLISECSSQPGRLPSAWLQPRHWSAPSRVIILDSVAPGCRAAIARAAQRPVERAEGSLLEHEWRGEGAMAVHLAGLIKGARLQPTVANDLLEEVTGQPGDFAAAPISVHGGMSEGRSFYAFTVERRIGAGSGRSDRILHRYHTVVLRSDGTLLEAVTLPAPPGTPVHRKVHALSDGTRIHPIQDPGHYCSWSLAGIRRFVAARQSGEDPSHVALPGLAASAVGFLKDATCLPRERDYWVLSSFVLASYMFRLFDALPIIHLEGEKGSGKSELLAALVSLAFNGQTMAQGSAAALVRLVKETGGLVGLDDAEALSDGGGEIGQALKQGYKQSTAVKFVALPSGRTESIDFFGPRVVSNTLGLDPVLGSRAIRISTCSSLEIDKVPLIAEQTIPEWRDAAHSFAMSRLGEVANVYSMLRRDVRTRRDEIWAPLRAITVVVGSDEMSDAISSAFADDK